MAKENIILNPLSKRTFMSHIFLDLKLNRQFFLFTKSIPVKLMILSFMVYISLTNQENFLLNNK